MKTQKAKRKRAAADAAASKENRPAAVSSRPAIVLASNCNVKDAAELKQSLCHYLDDSVTVELDAGKVERIDTATMQLLCAFVRDRMAAERKVEWVGDARVIRDAARLLGVESLLALPAAGGAQ